MRMKVITLIYSKEAAKSTFYLKIMFIQNFDLFFIFLNNLQLRI